VLDRTTVCIDDPSSFTQRAMVRHHLHTAFCTAHICCIVQIETYCALINSRHRLPLLKT
jgi:hypothetical protein